MNPVVATVLLIGIVIILSASIGTFVLGIGTGLDGSPQAGADIRDVAPHGTDGSLVVSLISLENTNYVTITAVASDGNELRDTDGSTTSERIWRQEAVGQPVTIEEGNASSSASDTTVRIVVVAHSSSAESVILDREVTI